MDNVKFNYRYRDAGNYKKRGSVVFSNPEHLSLGAITKALHEDFLSDGLFIAHQIRIPEVFLAVDGGVTEDDHCFHEFDAVETSSKTPNDTHHRSIREFINEVNREAKTGWQAFDPHDRVRLVGGPAMNR
jgi:hypothetical protein